MPLKQIRFFYLRFIPKSIKVHGTLKEEEGKREKNEFSKRIFMGRCISRQLGRRSLERRRKRTIGSRCGYL